MWRVTWRDLAYRRRRFVIAGAATALVFSVTLLLGGVLTAIHNQNHRIVDSFAAGNWWVPAGVTGPFTAGPAMSVDAVAVLAATPGIQRADPVLLMRSAADVGRADPVDINLVGLAVGGLGTPVIAEGRAAATTGEAVVDRELDIDVGDTVAIGGGTFTVVGTADRVSYLFGLPTIFLPLTDAQMVSAGGLPLISGVVTQGSASAPPDGLAQLTDGEVYDDLARPMENGVQTIDVIRTILTLTALGIVGLIIYLSSLERSRDVAVLKATGASGRFVAGGLAVQAVIVTLAAAGAGAVLATILAPGFPIALEMTLTVYLQLFALAVFVGLAASLVGIRRALKVDPALAFG